MNNEFSNFRIILPQKTVINPVEPMKRKTAYEYLYQMCKNIRNSGNALDGNYENITDRAIYIIEQLNDMKNVQYKIIPFTFGNVNQVGYGQAKLINIEVFFKATHKTKKTLVYTAHHDIANPNSENCQDNTASVCNLLDLCDQVRKMRNRKRNVLIVWTDCEEIGGRGASKLCQRMKTGMFEEIESVISLEVSAHGQYYWAEQSQRTWGMPVNNGESLIANKFMDITKGEGKFVNTPYNENMTIRSEGFDGICIGCLPKDEFDGIDGGGGYSSAKSWVMCHRTEDTFETSADREDLVKFVRFLKKFINHEAK